MAAWALSRPCNLLRGKRDTLSDFSASFAVSAVKRGSIANYFLSALMSIPNCWHFL